MATLHMLIGIPGSGKSTYVRNTLINQLNNAIIVSSDEVRNLHPDFDEDHIWPEIYRLCAIALLENKELIFDATNITPKVRKRFFDELEKRNVKFDSYQKIAYYFTTDVEICYQRVLKRNQNPNERYLPVEVIRQYNANKIMPTEEEGFCKIVVVED